MYHFDPYNVLLAIAIVDTRLLLCTYDIRPNPSVWTLRIYLRIELYIWMHLSAAEVEKQTRLEKTADKTCIIIEIYRCK